MRTTLGATRVTQPVTDARIYPCVPRLESSVVSARTFLNERSTWHHLASEEVLRSTRVR